MKVCLVALVLSSSVFSVHGHGRLTVPTTRNGNPQARDENDPVRGGLTSEDFVCRHATRNTNVPYKAITAGQNLDIRWQFGAAHVGDCAVYLSYDVDAARADQKYFKIANLFKCKDQGGATIKIPPFVPAGKAIIRWDWYAIHVWPSVEWYSQCVDVDITSTSTAQISEFTTYSIINPPIYPSAGKEGVGFRNPYDRFSEQYMTGPACANNYDENDCAKTAKGTPGYTGGGGENIGSGGTAQMGTTPAPGAPSVTPSPLCEIYTVVSGDTMAGIAQKFTDAGKKVTFQEICAANGKAGPAPAPSSCDIIDVGDNYIIPYEGSCCAFAGQGSSAGSQTGCTTPTSPTPSPSPDQGTVSARASTAKVFLATMITFTTALYGSI